VPVWRLVFISYNQIELFFGLFSTQNFGVQNPCLTVEAALLVSE
jgi:hypothetical protein